MPTCSVPSRVSPGRLGRACSGVQRRRGCLSVKEVEQGRQRRQCNAPRVLASSMLLLVVALELCLLGFRVWMLWVPLPLAPPLVGLLLLQQRENVLSITNRWRQEGS